MLDMSVVRCGSALLPLLPLFLVRPAYAGAPGICRVVNVEFTPGGIAAGPNNPEFDPQIVAWLEKPNGQYVQTIE